MAATTPRRGLRRDPESLSARRLIVTTGEPAGIGPDIALAAALSDWSCELVFAGDPELLAARAALLGLAIRPGEWREAAASVPHRAGTLPVLPAKLAAAATPGRPDPANARYVLETIEVAARGCLEGRFAAMVTAPVQKSSINEAGIAFKGHTEYLADLGGGVHPVMLLVADRLRVALATTHLPLADVSRHITRDSLEKTLIVLDRGLRDAFRLDDAPHRRLRPQSACGGSGPPRARGNRSHPPVAGIAQGARHRGQRAGAGGHRLHAGFARGCRCRARDVPRPGIAGDQARGFRPHRQCHARTAVSAHLGRSRHGARSRRHRARGSRAACSRRSVSRNSSDDPRAQAFRSAFPARPGRPWAHRRGDRSEAGRAHRRDRSGPRRAVAAAARALPAARSDRNRPRPDSRAARTLRGCR